MQCNPIHKLRTLAAVVVTGRTAAAAAVRVAEAEMLAETARPAELAEATEETMATAEDP